MNARDQFPRLADSFPFREVNGYFAPDQDLAVWCDGSSGHMIVQNLELCGNQLLSRGCDQRYGPVRHEAPVIAAEYHQRTVFPVPVNCRNPVRAGVHEIFKAPDPEQAPVDIVPYPARLLECMPRKPVVPFRENLNRPPDPFCNIKRILFRDIETLHGCFDHGNGADSEHQLKYARIFAEQFHRQGQGAEIRRRCPVEYGVVQQPGIKCGFGRFRHNPADLLHAFQKFGIAACEGIISAAEIHCHERRNSLRRCPGGFFPDVLQNMFCRVIEAQNGTKIVNRHIFLCFSA